MNKPRHSVKKGFTLIELLVVVAIIAILSIVVLLTLNPAELIRQSRDSNRISDLSTLKTALSLYLTDTANPNLASSSFGYSACYLSTLTGVGTSPARCGVFANTYYTTNASATSATYRKLDSTGWIPVSFTQLSIGTPFGQLPTDPLNNGNYYYAYAATSSGYLFEVNAFMESKKYGANGTNDVVSFDGGDNASTYEVGTNLKL